MEDFFDFNTHLSQYLHVCKVQGTSARNLRDVKSSLGKLRSYLDESGLCLTEIRAKQAQQFQGWIMEQVLPDGNKYAPNTVRNLVQFAKSFYDFLKSTGIVYTNPFSSLHKVRPEYKLPRNVLKPDEMQKLLKSLMCFDSCPNMRDRINLYKTHVICELMYATGLRISEVAGIKQEDIDLDRGIIRVKQAKAGIERTAYLNDYVCHILRIYIDRMRSLTFRHWEHRINTLFGANYEGLTKFLNKILKTHCRKLGLKPITSHGFRHALGAHLLKAGCDIRYIQAILGHRKLKSTEIYTKIDKDDLLKILDTYHPRQWKAESDKTMQQKKSK